jgi:hypothetical protein
VKVYKKEGSTINDSAIVTIMKKNVNKEMPEKTKIH